MLTFFLICLFIGIICFIFQYDKIQANNSNKYKKDEEIYDSALKDIFEGSDT